MEQDNTDAPHKANATKKVATRVRIRVKSYQKRKHDPDNVSIKFFLDGLVRRGVLQDDSCAEIQEITFESHISKEEKTIIEITQVDKIIG